MTNLSKNDGIFGHRVWGIFWRWDYDPQIRLLALNLGAELSKLDPDVELDITVPDTIGVTWDANRVQILGSALALALHRYLGQNPTIRIRQEDAAVGKLRFITSYSFRPILT